MFCPTCGLEYTHKTNYCKRCGGELNLSDVTSAPKRTQPNVTGMIWAIVVFFLSAFALLLAAVDHFLYTRGMNQKPLGAMFGVGALFICVVTLLLYWQLARMVTAFRRSAQNVTVEKRIIREAPPVVATTDQIPHAFDSPSVVESTTRQFANIYEKPEA